jgi:hypothetical protein
MAASHGWLPAYPRSIPLYTGSLPAVSNRETWSLSVTVTDDAGAAVDLTGATVTIGVREPESLQARATYTSGDGKLAISAPATGGIFTLNADLDPTTFPPGQYEVGVVIKLASGVKRQLVVATLPVVDGVVTAA